MGDFPWDDDHVELLKKLWAEGASFSAIAAELGCASRNAVIGKAHRIGLRGLRKRGSAPTPHAPKPKRAYTRRPKLVEPVSTAAPDELTIVEQIEAQPAPAEFLGIAFFDLQPNTCRYPRGEGANVLFCGQPVISESSYCAGCHRVCHSRVGEPLNLSPVERARRRQQALANNRWVAA